MGHPMVFWWPESALPRDSILLVSWWHVLARATSAPTPRKDEAQVAPKIPKAAWKQAVEWWGKKAVHPGKLTCPLKRDYSNRKYIFQPLIFGGYVSFRGSNSDGMNQFLLTVSPPPRCYQCYHDTTKASMGSIRSSALTTVRRTNEATTQLGGRCSARAWRSGTWLPPTNVGAAHLTS